MFEITPSTEFSAWFESLSAQLAEEVACALDVLAEAGVALGPSHASRALLWFDGTGRSEYGVDFTLREQRVLRGFDLAFDAAESSSVAPLPAHVRRALSARELLHWQHEAVRCLESAAFRERLARLEPKAASVALLAVEDLRVRLKAAGKWLAVQPRSKPTGESSRPAQQASAGSAELKESFFQVLRLVGLDPSPVMNSLSGLCELSIPNTEPPLRVLFGLDALGQRIVALFGEALTRSYYGDSVTLAEQRWRQYCADPASITNLSRES